MHHLLEQGGLHVSRRLGRLPTFHRAPTAILALSEHSPLTRHLIGGRHHEVAFYYLFVQFFFSWCFKRLIAEEHHEQYHASGPNVRGRTVVRLLRADLRGHVGGGTAKDLHPVLRLCCETEIDDLSHRILRICYIDHNIVWFQIPMGNMDLVEVT